MKDIIYKIYAILIIFILAMIAIGSVLLCGILLYDVMNGIQNYTEQVPCYDRNNNLIDGLTCEKRSVCSNMGLVFNKCSDVLK